MRTWQVRYYDHHPVLERLWIYRGQCFIRCWRKKTALRLAKENYPGHDHYKVAKPR
jgi:hypothetical protein